MTTFPKAGRLLKRSDFLRAARRGVKAARPGLVLQAYDRDRDMKDSALPDGQGASPFRGMRLGLTASRKVGNAVTRNRARRRLRSAAEEVLPVCGRPRTDYVLIARAETPVRPYDALLEDLRSAIRQIEKKRGGTGKEKTVATKQ
ncbi:ribonuclease P protein component [Fodinicurvata halophila]|uniref:Ribonuclease P protein component n=1 Tax=Fodinicurvata halophila TaxID=1419723 RepID=A0ABV8UN59_9PROT